MLTFLKNEGKVTKHSLYDQEDYQLASDLSEIQLISANKFIYAIFSIPVPLSYILCK